MGLSIKILKILRLLRKYPFLSGYPAPEKLVFTTRLTKCKCVQSWKENFPSIGFGEFVQDMPIMPEYMHDETFSSLKSVLVYLFIDLTVD